MQTRQASMRPRLFAAENMVTWGQCAVAVASFNEAAAVRRGKPEHESLDDLHWRDASMRPRLFAAENGETLFDAGFEFIGFNEAAAVRRGKLARQELFHAKNKMLQ